MHTTRLLVFAALFAFAGAAPAQFPSPGPEGGALHTDPQLRAAPPGSPLSAVLVFQQYPDAVALAALRAADIQVHAYRALPMVAVQGTALQLNSLPELAGLRAIALDRPLRAWGSIQVAGDGAAAALIGAGHRDGSAAQTVTLAPDLFGAGPLVLEGLDGSEAPGPLSLLSALQAFDWVLQNRLQYGIRAIHGSWVANGESRDPVSVAIRLARRGGLAVQFDARER